MRSRYSLSRDGSFTIKNYNSASPFSNFLPGVAGKWGIPLWAFYVNRAQGMISFGVHDRNHPIAEFYPADRAYRAVSTVGFRTFIKINGGLLYEPFRLSSDKDNEVMCVTSYDLTLEEKKPPLSVKVRYFTLPGMPFAALIRKLTLKNISSHPLDLEVLDGLPRIIPFGARDLFLKNLSRTIEAWMYSDIRKGMTVFKLLVDPKDVAQTKYVEGANFNCAFFGDKEPVYPSFVVDPVKIFGMDTSFQHPLEFQKKSFKVPRNQVTCGRTPCAFSFFHWRLKKGEERTFYSLFGGVFNAGILKDVVASVSASFIEEKEKENKKLIEDIKDHALCLSSSNTFNHYVRNTYLDNVLRGGYPYSLNNNHSVYYIYSRKHGDLERDYNKFKIFASFFSEGDTNYRDVNQNRRIDLFFNPTIGKDSVVYFMNLIKMDGYNPLVVKGEKLYFEDREEIENILDEFAPGIKDKGDFVNLMHKGFYLGEFFIMFMDKGVKVKNREKLLEKVLPSARRMAVASFKDGCWIDHWRYNLDLIESFLYFYPERVQELFMDTSVTFWDDEYRVKERWQRYILKDGRVQQIGSVEEVPEKKAVLEERKDKKNFLRKGKEIYTTNLFVKLLIIILNKLATFDPDGVGIEMEADKPGWCDSLNGLPALFGSSLCEVVELKRAARMSLEVIKEVGEDRTIEIPDEVFNFYHGLAGLLKDYLSSSSRKKDYLWWDKANIMKESFRRNTFWRINGKVRKIPLSKVRSFLNDVIRKVDLAIKKAYDKKTGLYYTYFFYEVSNFRKSKDGFIMPLSFKRRNIPLFLEGMVHLLRTEKKRQIVVNMRKSSLFDRKLKMYRLNLSLKDQPLAIGRSRVFPRGWLENESVWLHMEYKYLLELLKNGYYKDFYRDFYRCIVCFFDPSVYGRSVLENSSFIVSSVYPDSSLWGKGFVARLTGATVEFLNMWMVMALGHKPFFVDSKRRLCFRPAPIIKGELFTVKEEKIMFSGEEIVIPPNCWAFKMFSSTLVVYHNPHRKDTFKIKAKRIIVQENDRVNIVNSDVIGAPLSYRIRERKAKRIDVYF